MYKRQADECLWEAHRKYIDIQYIIQGLSLIHILLFAGQTGYYYNINLPKNIKKIGVFHGLRSLECPIDYYSYMYDEKFIDKTKSCLLYTSRCV